jgi:hypothetical protein
MAPSVLGSRVDHCDGERRPCAVSHSGASITSSAAKFAGVAGRKGASSGTAWLRFVPVPHRPDDRDDGEAAAVLTAPCETVGMSRVEKIGYGNDTGADL